VSTLIIRREERRQERKLTSMPDCSSLDIDERVVGGRVDLGSEYRVRVGEIRGDGTEPL